MKKLADLADLAVFMDLGLVPNCSMLSKVLVLARRGGGVGQARRWCWPGEAVALASTEVARL